MLVQKEMDGMYFFLSKIAYIHTMIILYNVIASLETSKISFNTMHIGYPTANWQNPPYKNIFTLLR